MEIDFGVFSQNADLVFLPDLLNNSDVPKSDNDSFLTANVSTVSPEYEQFLTDVWVGIVLTLMIITCVCCLCTCLVYHKFQEWKRNVIDARNASENIESSAAASHYTEADLPSYTIASGLPSYEEALEQLNEVKEPKSSTAGKTITVMVPPDDIWVPRTPPTPTTVPLSAVQLFRSYKSTASFNFDTNSKPA